MELHQRIRQALVDCRVITQAGASTTAPRQGEAAVNPPLLVAISAGADSTALLVALKQIATEQGLTIIACHVNHQIRGAESDQDESFCHTLCHSLKFPLDVRKASEAMDYEAGKSEETLRDLRYQLLLAAAKQAEARYVLTAHTLDDQIETLLFRLCRGTSLKGLTGMRLCRPLSEEVSLIRPLLTISKDQCRRFLIEKGLAAREDSSNLNPAYTRNYLRNAIIPKIESRFGDFKQRLEQLRQIIEAEEDCLDTLTGQLLLELESCRAGEPNAWDIQFFQAQPLALKRRLIAEALRRRDIEVSFQRVEAILELLADGLNAHPEKGKKWLASLTLNDTWQLRLTKRDLVWFKIEQSESPPFSPLSVKIPGNTIALLPGRVLRIEAMRGDEDAPGKLDFPPACAEEALVDLSEAALPIVLRSRAPGDVIQPLGMANKVRLKQYLHTHKPESQSQLLRSFSIVLADQEEVLWVPGVGLSEKIRVRNKPSHRLKWLPLATDELTLA
jgi:tRNA(Ile)-lysidine synthase